MKAELPHLVADNAFYPPSKDSGTHRNHRYLSFDIRWYTERGTLRDGHNGTNYLKKARKIDMSPLYET